eukprot:12893982-Prorocentrum_lima.AAC.1
MGQHIVGTCKCLEVCLQDKFESRDSNCGNAPKCGTATGEGGKSRSPNWGTAMGERHFRNKSH